MNLKSLSELLEKFQKNRAEILNQVYKSHGQCGVVDVESYYDKLDSYYQALLFKKDNMFNRDTMIEYYEFLNFLLKNYK